MVFNKKTKGSVTIFVSLTIIMVISLILSLVEVVHFTAIKKLTEPVSKIGAESAFADFNRYLYEEFGVLAIDGGYGKETFDIVKLEERILPYLRDNINPEGRGNFLRADPKVSLTEYGVLTDSFGAAFIKQAAISKMYELPSDVINAWDKLGNDLESGNLSQNSVEELLNNSKESLSNIDSNDSKKEVIVSELPPIEQEQFERNGNPIDAILSFKSKAVLSQVIGDLHSISTKEISTDIPSKRGRANWNRGANLTVNPREKAIFALYLKDKFSSYVSKKEREGIGYEWEYVIAGKNSDMKNLETIVVRLLALREVQNLASIMADPIKVSKAYSIATAICAGLALPALIEPVKLGIIAAWAYIESVLDVRLLLQGGKVALVKSPAEWTSNILLFPNYIRTDVSAYPSQSGMSYEDYLLSMSLVMQESQLGLRSVDVAECALRSSLDYQNIRLENSIYCAKFLFDYKATPIFASLTPILSGKLNTYEFHVTEELSYI